MMLTVEQIRAARALKGWSQKELGERAGLSQTAITNIEVGKFRPTQHTSDSIRKAFEDDNIEFIQGGVRVRPSAVMTIQGEDYAPQIMDLAFSIVLQRKEKEILISGVDYKAFDEALWDQVRNHVDRLKKAGISQRILTSPSNEKSDLIGPADWHRSVSQDVFTATTPTMIFSDYYAMMLQDQKEWLIIINHALANNQRRVFDYIWEKANPYS